MSAVAANSGKRGKPFRPGASGNPTGRPKKSPQEYALEEACREKAPDALKKILALMGSADKDKVSLDAAIFVIERGYGKAAEIEAPKSELEEAATDMLLAMRDALQVRRAKLIERQA